MFKKPYTTSFHVHLYSVHAYICKWDKLQPWLLELVLQQQAAKYPGLGVCRRALAIYRVKPRGTRTIQTTTDPDGFWQFMISELGDLRLPNSCFRYISLSLYVPCICFHKTWSQNPESWSLSARQSTTDLIYPKIAYFCGGSLTSLIKGVLLFICEMIWTCPNSTEEMRL